MDERLDELHIALRRCPIENFKPLTPVELHLSNRLYFGETTVDTQTEVDGMLSRTIPKRSKVQSAQGVGTIICISSS